MKYSQLVATRFEKKKLAPHKKNICGYGGVYTMENKDKNTDYHKFVRVGDQKRGIVETTTRINFFA